MSRKMGGCECGDRGKGFGCNAGNYAAKANESSAQRSCRRDVAKWLKVGLGQKVGEANGVVELHRMQLMVAGL